jgi:hypothetical protein
MRGSLIYRRKARSALIDRAGQNSIVRQFGLFGAIDEVVVLCDHGRKSRNQAIRYGSRTRDSQINRLVLYPLS